MKFRRLTLFCAAVLITVLCFYGTAMAESSYGYGERMLYWKDTVFVGDSQYVYAITEGGTNWDKIGFDGHAADFFAEDYMVYYVLQDNNACWLAVYNMWTAEEDILQRVNIGTRIVGADGSSLYFLEQDGEDYEGKTLKCYDWTTDAVSDIAASVGNAVYWEGAVFFTGMATDISPVDISMLNRSGQISSVASDCGSAIYADETGVYYTRCNMTDDTAWTGLTLCRIDGGQPQELAFVEGDYLTAYPLAVINGYCYFSCWKDGGNAVVSVSLEGGSCYETDTPVPGAAAAIYKDGGNVYWYADYGIYYWKGAGYQKLSEIPSDATMLGIGDNTAFYWRYNGSQRELFCSPL